MQGLYGYFRRNLTGKKGQAGFTLIELLVVVTILGVLAAIVTLSLVGLTTNAQAKACALLQIAALWGAMATIGLIDIGMILDQLMCARSNLVHGSFFFGYLGEVFHQVHLMQRKLDFCHRRRIQENPGLISENREYASLAERVRQIRSALITWTEEPETGALDAPFRWSR